MTGIESLLDSRSLAVVGASDTPGSPGMRAMQTIVGSGFTGEVLPVNPRRPLFGGAPAAATLDDVRPGPIDHVLVLTPAHTVPDVLRSCVARGVGAVTVLSSGIGDGDVAAQTGRLRSILGNSGMRVLGPNCLGVVNAHSGLIASPASAFVSGRVSAGPISIVSQSGAVGAYLVGLLSEAGLGVRYFASTGNETDLRLGEIVGHYAQDEQTGAVVIYLEGLRDVESFIAAVAECRRQGKNVVVIKAGATSVGAAAVQSHTAALAGDDAAYDAVFDRLGVFRAGSITEAAEALAAALAPMRITQRVERLAVITTSGGLGILAAEALVGQDFELPDVPDSTQRQMIELLPFCTPHNPIDLGGTVPSDPAAFLRLLQLTVTDLQLDGLVVVVSNLTRSPVAWASIRDTLTRLIGSTRAVVAVVGALSGDDSAYFRSLGAITATDPASAARELRVLDRVTAARSTSGSVRAPDVVEAPAATAALADVEAMALLADSGVPFPDQLVIDLTGDETVDLSGVLLPAAVKLLQTGVLHKAAAGNVVTGVTDLDDLERLVEKFRAKATGAGHILVQTMVGGALAEIIVSARRDETFGPMYVIGTGGRHVELLQDRVILLEPVTPDDIAEAVGRLTFLGDLGPHASACTNAVTQVVDALRLALANDHSIVEIEVNPVILRSQSPAGIAVDAVVQVGLPRTPDRHERGSHEDS